MGTLTTAVRSMLPFFSLWMLTSGCGARSTVLEGGPATPPTAIALYVPDGEGCVDALDVGDAVEVMSPGAEDDLAVVDLAWAEECTGLGGQYLLAREIDASRYFWLGAHGCQFADQTVPGTGLVYGVVRYRQTAALFDIPPDWCVAFPDEPPGVQTSAITDAIAVFEMLSEAQAFAASL